MARIVLPSGVAGDGRDERIQRRVLSVAVVVIAVVFVFHAAMELLYCLPPNPLGEQFRPLVLRYTHPYLEQYWNMFAPSPIESDISVVARVHRPNGSIGPWADLTSALLAQTKRGTFSQYSTLKIVGMSLAVSTKNDRHLRRSKFSPAEAAVLVDSARRPMQLEGLRRLALFLSGASPADMSGVELALVEHRYPRFTHRAEMDDPHQANAVVRFPPLSSLQADGSEVTR